jgi:hypothetical protein
VSNIVIDIILLADATTGASQKNSASMFGQHATTAKDIKTFLETEFPELYNYWGMESFPYNQWASLVNKARSNNWQKKLADLYAALKKDHDDSTRANNCFLLKGSGDDGLPTPLEEKKYIVIITQYVRLISLLSVLVLYPIIIFFTIC